MPGFVSPLVFPITGTEGNAKQLLSGPCGYLVADNNSDATVSVYWGGLNAGNPLVLAPGKFVAGYPAPDLPSSNAGVIYIAWTGATVGGTLSVIGTAQPLAYTAGNNGSIVSSVIIPGTLNVQGVPGGTAIGVSIAESVALTIQGTVNIGSIASTVVVSGTVTVGSITNPVTVQGTVDIGSITSTVAISGTVTVGSITNPVTVNGTVTVGSITNTVAISGTVTVGSITNAIAVTNVGSITETVNVAGSVASAISNTILPSTSLVLLHQASVTVTNLANGASFYVAGDTDNTGVFPYAQLGLWDGYVVFIRSSSGYRYTMNAPSAIVTSAVLSIGGSNYALQNITWATIFPLSPVYNGNAGSAVITALATSPFPANIANTQWVNNNGATIASDVVTVTVYGIKAQVTNPLSNPVAQQAANGEFATLSFTNSGTATGPANVSGDGTEVSTTITILGSGDYVSSITWDNLVLEVGANNVSGGTWNAQAYLQLGSMNIASVGISGTTDGLGHSGTIPAGTLSWGGKAIPNGGITISIYVQGSSSTGTIAVSSSNVNYALISMVLESVTAPSEVSQIA